MDDYFKINSHKDNCLLIKTTGESVSKCFVVQSFNHKDMELPIENATQRFAEINEQSFQVDVLKNSYYPVKIHPPHYRKSLQLEPLDKSIIQVEDIDNSIKTKLFELIDEYQRVFSRSDSGIGCYNGPLSYEISLANPIKETYRERSFSASEDVYGGRLQRHSSTFDLYG